MPKYILFLLCLMMPCVYASYGQSIPFKQLDRKSKNIFLFTSPDAAKLARRLTSQYSTDEEKVRAIYIWITNNIKYDVKRFKRGVTTQNTIETTLKKRKALCSEYSDLFVALCNYAGVEAMPVKGFLRGTGMYEDQYYYVPNHEWNIVKINGEWKVIDLTLASGYIKFVPGFSDYLAWINIYPRVPMARSKMKFRKKRNDAYCLPLPEQFILYHFPAEKMYQLLKNPVPVQVFEQDEQSIKTFLNSPAQPFDFNQAIAAYQSAPLLQQYLWVGDSCYATNHRNAAFTGIYYSLAAVAKLDESGARSKRTRASVPDTLAVHAADSLALLSDSQLAHARLLLNEERTEKHLRNSKRKQLAHDEIAFASKMLNSSNAFFSLSMDKYVYLKRHEAATQNALNQVLIYYRKLEFPENKLNLPADSSTLGLVMDNNRKLIQNDLDSISVNLDAIHVLFKQLDTLWFDTVAAWNTTFTRLNKQLLITTLQLSEVRSNFFSSLSAEVVQLVYVRKVIIDSMNLILAQKKAAIKIQKNMEQLMKERLKNIKEYTKTIRRKLIENIKMGQAPGTTQAYTEALDKYEAALAVYAARFTRFKKFAEDEIIWCSKNSKLNKKISHELFVEGWYESKRYNLFNDLFNNQKKRISHGLMIAQRYNRQTMRLAKQTLENERRLLKLKAGTR